MSLRHAAFSLVETLVVLAILAASIGFSVLYAQTDDVRTDLHTQAAVFVSYLREMQTDAASGKNDSAAGVHLEADRYVLFRGASYNALASGNFVVELPAVLQIANIHLNGGASDIIFSTPLGETNQYGSLDFVSDSIGQSVTIFVNSLGSVNYE